MKFFRSFVVSVFSVMSFSTANAQLQWSNETSNALGAAIDVGNYQTITSVVIRQHGTAVYEGYFNGADATSQHNTRSVTKTINGMVLGAAIEAGEIKGVNARVFPYFKDKRPILHDDKRKRDITIEDLLTMSSPLECNDWNQFSQGNEERMYIVEDMARFYLDLPMRGYPVWSPPPQQRPFGRAFSYCTAGANLVAKIVERATGENIEDYAQQHLFTPLGIDSISWPRTGTGDIMATGGLELTSDTLARLGELYLGKGTFGGNRILPESWVSTSIEPRAQVDDDTNYGYLWWLEHYEVDGKNHPVAYMSGNGGNRVMILPDHDLVVVITKTDYGTRGMHDAAQALFDDFIVANLETSVE